MNYIDPLGLYEVAFLHNIGLPDDPGHPAIVFTQDGTTYTYYKAINQTGAPGVPLQGDLYKLNDTNLMPGGIDIYQLDPNIFKNSQVPDVKSEGYSPIPIPGFSSNCSSYAADVLNYSIKLKNSSLKPGEKPILMLMALLLIRSIIHLKKEVILNHPKKSISITKEA